MWELYLSFDSDTPLLYSNCPASHGTYAMARLYIPLSLQSKLELFLSFHV